MAQPSNMPKPILTFFLVAFLLNIETFAIQLDPDFGAGGKFMTTFAETGAPSAWASRVFIQPSTRVVAIGRHDQQGTSVRRAGIALVGLTSAGALDASFGTSGKTLVWNPGYSYYPVDYAMLADGSILALVQSDGAPSNEPRVVRFTPSGHLDAGFDGKVDVTPNDTFPVRMATDATGKIYVIVRNATTTELHLIRLNTDGSRDTTFGPNGVRVLRLSRFDRPQINVFTASENGKLMIGGTHSDLNFNNFTFLVRLDSDSNVDRSFGRQGVIRPGIPGGIIYFSSLLEQPDGKLLFSGGWTFLGSTSLLLRTSAKGRADATFGSRGIAQAAFNDWNVIERITRLPNGKLFGAGGCGDKALPSNARVLLVSYSSSGVLESSLVTNFIGTREAQAFDVTPTPDGKVLIAGYTQNPTDTNGQFVVARYIP